jgi:predicted Abi (CAAX) family protease
MRFEARITNGVPVVFDREVYTHYRTGGRPRDPVFINIDEAQWVANRANTKLAGNKAPKYVTGARMETNVDVLRARFNAAQVKLPQVRRG